MFKRMIRRVHEYFSKKPAENESYNEMCRVLEVARQEAERRIFYMNSVSNDERSSHCERRLLEKEIRERGFEPILLR